MVLRRLAASPGPDDRHWCRGSPAVPQAPPGEPVLAGPGGRRSMAPRIIVAVACLLGGLLAGTPVAAAPPAGSPVRLDRPVTAEGSAHLSGRAPGHARVVLQRRTGHGWQNVRAVRVRH